ncbi:unnamed protein product [Urochloa humidicola]
MQAGGRVRAGPVQIRTRPCFSLLGSGASEGRELFILHDPEVPRQAEAIWCQRLAARLSNPDAQELLHNARRGDADGVLQRQRAETLEQGMLQDGESFRRPADHKRRQAAGGSKTIRCRRTGFPLACPHGATPEKRKAGMPQEEKVVVMFGSIRSTPR